MKANPNDVLTGTHYLSGNQACAEGALAAGCKFFAGYPIPPSIEVMNRFLERAPEVNATFVQMEDEISALAAVLGAAWTGIKAMTVTSGPGFSLMMEHIGLGVMLETPCVIVNVQRVGPAHGVPNLPSQADMMQARWGSHGDYEVIALTPNSPQEMFEHTIKAFNLSEQYRVPVMLMADKYVAYMSDKVKIPSPTEIEIVPRRYYKGPKDKYLPFRRDDDLVPPMVKIGDGYRFHVTGLTHDERGYPIMNEECQEFCVHPLVKKIRYNANKIIEFDENNTDDAEVIVISYGVTSTIACKAIEQARKAGISVGSFRLITVWPFPEHRIAELAKKTKAFIVLEMNYGQIFFEVERCAHGNAKVMLVSPKGAVHDTNDILRAIKEAVKSKTK